MKEIFDKLYTDIIGSKSTWSNQSEIDFKASLLRPLINDKDVLLMGCGDFALGFSIAEFSRHISGFDFSDVAIKHALANDHYEKNKTSLFIRSALEIIDGVEKADVVVDDYLSHCLVESREVYFQNVHRLLKPDGLFVTLAVAWPDDYEWPDFVKTTLDPVHRTQVHNGKPVRIFKRPAELASELTQSGFQTEYSKVIFNPTGQPIYFSLNKIKD